MKVRKFSTYFTNALVVMNPSEATLLDENTLELKNTLFVFSDSFLVP